MLEISSHGKCNQNPFDQDFTLGIGRTTLFKCLNGLKGGCSNRYPLMVSATYALVTRFLFPRLVGRAQLSTIQGASWEDVQHISSHNEHNKHPFDQVFYV